MVGVGGHREVTLAPPSLCFRVSQDHKVPWDLLERRWVLGPEPGGVQRELGVVGGEHMRLLPSLAADAHPGFCLHRVPKGNLVCPACPALTDPL